MTVVLDVSSAATSAALPVWFEIAVMSLNSLFGAAIARSRNTPIVGTLMAALLVGLGGGMVRDMLLGQEPVAITNPAIIPSAVLGGVIGALLFGRVLSRTNRFALVQGITLGFLVTIGAQKALDLDAPMLSAVVLGVVTASFGGMLADVMTGYRATVARQAHWVITALTLGSLAFVLVSVTVGFWVAVVVGVIVVAVLRFVSQWRGWSSPRWPGESMNTPDTPSTN